MKTSAIITEKAIAIFTSKGQHLTMSVNDGNFKKVLERVKKRKFNGIEKLFDLKTPLEKGFGFKIKGNKIYWNAKEINNSLTQAILRFRKNGYPMEDLVNFFKLLQSNPDSEARDSLYDYLTSNLLPIDPDGYFYAAKAIQSNWMDKYSGKVSNKIGEYVSMKREDVCRSRHECSGAGLHCGNAAYVGWYGGGDDRFVLVRVNPRDVVIVPNEADKIRLCAYTVEKEITKETLAFKSDIASKNEQISSVIEKRFAPKGGKKVVGSKKKSKKSDSPYSHDGYKCQTRASNGRFGSKY